MKNKKRKKEIKGQPWNVERARQERNEGGRNEMEEFRETFIRDRAVGYDLWGLTSQYYGHGKPFLWYVKGVQLA